MPIYRRKLTQSEWFDKYEDEIHDAFQEEYGACVTTVISFDEFVQSKYDEYSDTYDEDLIAQFEYNQL